MRTLVTTLVAVFLTACGESATTLKANREEPAVFEPLDVSAMPAPEDPVLARGRTIYLQACERCHRIGKAGAPRTGEIEVWAPRIAKGIEILNQHALEGYESPTGHEMPARGGNEDLTDEEVLAAVQFILSLSRP